MTAVITSKRTLTAERKHRRKEIEKAIRTAIKGSGWRAKYNFAYRQIDALYLEANYRFTSPDPHSSLEFSLSVKPMALDPLFWSILHIDGNEAQPLSFRSVGAFTCYGLRIDARDVEDHGVDPVAVAFRDYLDVSSARVAPPFMKSSFADRVAEARAAGGAATSMQFQTHVLALLDEGRLEDAEREVQKGLEEDYSKHFSRYRDDQDSIHPFARMALRWIAEHRSDGGAR